jgi:hypothetical protein
MASTFILNPQPRTGCGGGSATFSGLPSPVSAGADRLARAGHAPARGLAATRQLSGVVQLVGAVA